MATFINQTKHAISPTNGTKNSLASFVNPSKNAISPINLQKQLSFLLLENGGHLLLEDGSRIILDTSNSGSTFVNQSKTVSSFSNQFKN